MSPSFDSPGIGLPQDARTLAHQTGIVTEQSQPAGRPPGAFGARWAGGLLALALVWFGLLGVRGLFAPDEGRYGLIPREMLASGDWVTPHLNALVYFEKPPLQYWLTAGFYALFGEHEWTVRLWPALTGFATLALVGCFAALRRGPAAAAIAVSVLASSLLFFFFSQVTTLDMGLTFFLTAGMFGLTLAAGDAERSARWAAFAWLALALAVLSKGLVALVLPGLTVIVYAALARDLSIVRRAHPLLGAVIVAFVAGPWMALAQIEHPQFFQFFFIHEHFARYSTTVHHRTGAWWYFLAVVAFGAMPWTALAAGIFRRSLLRRPPAGQINEAGLLALWVAIVVLFYSASDSKLPAYVLPVFPPLALLTAGAICDTPPARAARCAWPAALLGIALAAAAFVLVARDVDDVPAGMAAGYLPWIGAAALLLVAGAIAAAKLFASARPAPAAVVLGAAALLAWQLALTGSTSFEQAYSGREFARTVIAGLGPHGSEGEWYSVGTFDNSFAFYVKHPLIVVAYEDELKFGLDLDPRRGIPAMEDFVRQWTSARQSFAMMQPKVYQGLLERGVPMVLVARDLRRVFVARVPLNMPAPAVLPR